MPFSRHRRWIGIVLASVFGAALLLIVSAKIYLSTASARDLLAARLSQTLGASVQVDRMNIGWRSSEVGIRIFESPEGSLPPAVLLSAQSVNAAISLPQMLRGETPDRFRIKGAHLDLRLDRDGQLLSRLPKTESGDGPLPALEISDSSVTITQEGRPEFTLSGIAGRLEPHDRRFVLTLTARDPAWGQWNGEGDWDLERQTGSLTLRSELTPLTQRQLQSVPWVPDAVWEQVQAHGDSAAEIRVSWPTAGDLHTRVVLHPKKATVAISSIDLELNSVAGEIEVDDATVHLRSMTARTGNGDVQLTGKLDFESTPSLLKFQVNVRGIDLRSLPASWSLPAELEGSLRGQADLEVAIVNGEFQTHGQGHGQVENARVAGIPAERVELRLTTDGRRFRFTGARNAIGGLGVALVGVIVQPPTVQPPPAVELDFDFKDVDIADALKRLRIPAPVRLAGRVSLSAKTRLPLDRVRDLAAYELTGRATSSRLTIEGVDLEDVSANVVLRDGVLSIRNLTGKTHSAFLAERAGQIAGRSTIELVPQKNLTANLAIERVPIAIFSPLLNVQPGAMTGSVSGQVDFQAPMASIRDAKSWSARADIRSDRLAILDRVLHNALISARAQDGTAHVERATAHIDGADLAANSTVSLTSPFHFSGRFRANSTSPSDLRMLAPEFDLGVPVTGRVDAAGEFAGELSPLSIKASGTGGAAEVRVGPAHLDQLLFQWTLADRQLKFRDIKGELYQGALTAAVELPAGNADTQISVEFDRINARSLLRDWPAAPIDLNGRVAGSLSARIAAQSGQVIAKLDLSSRRLRVAGLPTDHFRAQLAYRPDAIDFQVTGDPLGGKLTWTGRAPLAPLGPPVGRLQLERLDLAQFFPDNSALRGRIELDLTHHDEGESLSGQGRFELRGLRGYETEIADRLTADLRIAGSVVTISGPDGGLAGGSIRGRGRYDLRGRERGFISLTFNGVDAKRLLAPFPALVRNVNATLDGQIRGSLAREFHGTGRIGFSRGRIFGLTVTDARFPFDWAFSPGGRGEVRFREMSAQGGTGRFTGQSNFLWGLENRLDGRVHFAGVDLKTVLTETADFSRISGRANGRFDFQGSNVREIDDLSGTLSATFAQASALESPILRPIAPYVAPGQSLTGFTRGELLAHLARGVFRIQRLALEAPALRLFGEGSVTTEGRLDLSINALTGQIGANPDLLRVAGLQLPAIGPIPVTLIVRASNMLSRHVIRLRVGGTICTPTVQVNAAALLSEGVIRYLLNPGNLPIP
jgi:uncharacterized protein involved in outer membrane biogenesis